MPPKRQIKTREPLWKENDYKSLKKGARHTVYSVNGDHFTGEWDDNKKNGKGTQFCKKNGGIYDGDWIDNLRDGFGTFSLPTKGGGHQKVYAGGWKDDKMHGHGSYYYTMTVYYEGEWKKDKRSGWGRMYYEDGSVYEGEWYQDKRNGIGMLRLSNENRYEGEWKDDMKHGDGKYYYLDKGQLLTGMWVNDIAKCGEIIDFNREGAVDATQYPLPEVKLCDANEVLERAREWFQSMN